MKVMMIGQKDTYKERKAMLGQAISLFHSLVSKGPIHVAVVINYDIGIVSFWLKH